MEQNCSHKSPGGEQKTGAAHSTLNPSGAHLRISSDDVPPLRDQHSTLPPLTSLRAISNRALKGDSLPTRIKIFNWGDNPSTRGVFKVGKKTSATLAANQRERGYERVALDYNHCSVPGSPEYEKLMENGQPPIIFGYGRPNLVMEDGLYLEDMQWTPLGAEKARNFEDLSPAAAAECGEIDFIHSVALTTNGCLHDVTFFSAEGGVASGVPPDVEPGLRPGGERPDPVLGTESLFCNSRAAGRRPLRQAGRLTPPATLSLNSITQQNPMTTSTNQFITLAALAGALGLAAEATEADLCNKLQRLAALEPLGDLLLPNGKTVLLSAIVDGRAVSLAPEDIVRLAARLDRLEADVRAGGQAARQIECGRILSLLAAEGKAPLNPDSGKAYTAEELKRLDLTTLRLLHANTPVTVPLRARTQATGTAGVDPSLRGRARFIAAQEIVNNQRSSN